MPTSQDFDLEAKSALKRFGTHTAVDSLSFGVKRGSFFSILGPSGCGKTTLLRMIAGFIEPDGGDIEIGGRSQRGVAPNRRSVNMVFQQLALFPMMSVGENVAYGLARRGVGRAERESKVRAMLERVGLPGAERKRTDELSGGQRQRVAIARSLVLEPTLLLLDEPLGALDLKLRERMKIELKQLQAAFGTTFVYITHDQSEALVLSDQVAVMNAGRFEQVGRPQQLYYSPATPFVAGFVGANNRIEGRVSAVHGALVDLATPEGWVVRAQAQTGPDGRKPGVGEAASAFVRPEVAVLGRSAAELDLPPAAAAAPVHEGVVESLLFDGANSAVLLREAKTRAEFRVALPLTSRWTSAWCSVSPPIALSALRPADMVEASGTLTRRLLLWLLLAPALVWLLGLILLPHLDLALLSFRERTGPGEYAYSLAQYRTFFAEPLYWDVFVRTAVISLIATAITLLIAFPIAWTIAKLTHGRVSALLFAVCLIPFWVSETVRTLGWMILLRETGVLPGVLVSLGVTDAPVELLYRDATILVGLVYTSLLFMVVPLYSSLESLDDSLIEAAYDLGGNGWTVLRTIVIPHAAPGITAGCIVVFMLTLGNYLTASLLGGKNSLWFTEQIYTQFITRFNWEQGAAFGFLLLVLSSLMVWIGLRLSGQKLADVMSRS